jgi:hypothetical protein
MFLISSPCEAGRRAVTSRRRKEADFNKMSHTDYITPFPMEDAYGNPEGWIPELRINADEFTQYLLKRWPQTSEPEQMRDEEGVTSYYYELRTVPNESERQLVLRYSCFVSIERPNFEVLASLAHIYRQCVPREIKVYIWGNGEVPLDISEEELSKLIAQRDVNPTEDNSDG